MPSFSFTHYPNVLSDMKRSTYTPPTLTTYGSVEDITAVPGRGEGPPFDCPPGQGRPDNPVFDCS
ncbi:hypothetical protein CRI93_03660 [Longimonas halophila]|uniref:Uncharacterized protein n=1 Tax=Longimonas halophila TaxID=1469170 RepID=A0A2H3NVY8_9BACT|nr:hypothetical protein CRI93_03660 [Longimonas halophila]